MRKSRLLRALVGGAGLASCIVFLAGQARAGPVQYLPEPYVSTSKIAPISPDLFGTIAIPVRADRYAAGWRRAELDASSLPLMQRLVAPARSLSREQQIAYIQAAVTQNIRWMSDATEWGRHDYWASAAETLEHGAGDMENRAIVKMQALRTLGVPARDLYMTMGRDKVGGPITVLMVRVGWRFYILDDLGGAPIPADHRSGFEPMLTLGEDMAWIHGHKIVRGTMRAHIPTVTASR